PIRTRRRMSAPALGSSPFVAFFAATAACGAGVATAAPTTVGRPTGTVTSDEAPASDAPTTETSTPATVAPGSAHEPSVAVARAISMIRPAPPDVLNTAVVVFVAPGFTSPRSAHLIERKATSADGSVDVTVYDAAPSVW